MGLLGTDGVSRSQVSLFAASLQIEALHGRRALHLNLQLLPSPLLQAHSPCCKCIVQLATVASFQHVVALPVFLACPISFGHPLLTTLCYDDDNPGGCNSLRKVMLCFADFEFLALAQYVNKACL